MTFGRLLYTDCRAGTGRGAGGGFQVQAQSEGVDSAQARMAVGWLLYEAQNAWIVERRPVEEFPLGFAHACEAGYGTAQSRYLGKEASGGRPGNHLADCLLTRDPDLYGPIRPAQLWRSPWWRAEPWETRDCPQFAADDLEPGPLTINAVADWVRDRQQRTSVLARLLSVLEEPSGRRVVIVATSPDEALTWIAAATLLLPLRQALEISFKVFSSHPLRTEHRIVAVPAELELRIAPRHANSSFILDATECAADDVETSARARFLVGQLASDTDPYDIIDAVELAEVLSGGERLGDIAATLTAWALTVSGSPLSDPSALVRWLSGAGPVLRREYGPSVGVRILNSASPAGPLRWLDDAVALGLDPVTVRTRLLSAELAEIGEGSAPPTAVLTPVSLGPGTRRDAESELSSAILLGSDQQVDGLLRLARRHGIEPELTPPLQQRLRSFAVSWIERPEAYSPDRWALRTEVLDSVYDELHDRIAKDGVASVLSAVRQFFRYFTPGLGDLSDPLQCHFQAAAITALRGPERTARVHALLEQATQPQQVAGVQQALIAWDAVDPDEAVAVIAGLLSSADIEPMIAKIAMEQLTQASARPTPELLDLLIDLEQRGIAPASDPVTDLLAADKYIQAFIHGAADVELDADPRNFDRVVSLLRQAEDAVVRARLDSVLQACLDSQCRDLGGVVLTTLDSPLSLLLIQRWSSTLGSRDTVRDGVWCVNCLTYPNLPVKQQVQLSAAAREYASGLSEQNRERWYAEVRRCLRPDQYVVWESVFTSEPRQRRKPWLNRSSGRL